MRLAGRRLSENVQDRRRSAAPIAVGGGLGVVIIAVIFALMGGDPGVVLQQGGPGGAGGLAGPGAGGVDRPLTPGEQAQGEFASRVLALTEDVWGRLFREQGLSYQEPELVLFSTATDSACGYASSATGPFYCPADSKVYIDLDFFEQLSDRFGAPGDFARAYVIAHEVGHHVQHQLGTTDRVDAMRGRVSQTEMNELSVRLELQADFYAGVFSHYLESETDILEPGDIEEALQAARAIGDDRLQRQTQGYVVPDSFTHGTSKQRYRWFMKGFETGDLSQGDTFNATSL